MTVSTTTNKVIRDGDGANDTFSYNFKIFADGDLDVYIRTAAGTETLQTLTTNYTVTGAGNEAGGNVVFVSGQEPAATEKVVIQRKLDLTQSTDYTPNDPFPADSHEEALDRLTFITQQIQEEVDRSIKASVGNTFADPEFTVDATTRANKIFAFDSDGDLSIAQEIGTYQGTDTTTTTEAYSQRDIVKSTSTAELNNVYICVADSVVGDLLTDTDHFELLVDAVSAATSATNAAASATSAQTAQTAAETAETNAETAQTAAETAKTGAETAKTGAETAKTAAETAQTAAETAQAAAETALDTFDDRFLGAKATDPTVDNDGNALIDGALYFDTTNDIMKVYDLTNTQWRQLTLTSSNQTNVNTVAGQISPTNNIATVASRDSDIGTVAARDTDIGTVASRDTDIGTVASRDTDIGTVAARDADIGTVASRDTDIGTLAARDAEIGRLGTADAVADLALLGTADAVADMNTLATSAIVADMDALADITSNITSVADNITGVNSFAERYRVSATAPSASLDVGDLWFDTTNSVMKVYGSGGFANAGSSVNGTSERQTYTAGTASGSYDGVSLTTFPVTYDAGFIDVYLNGIKQVIGTDVTATSGTDIVFTTAVTSGQIVDIVAFGTFNLANFSIGDATDVSLTSVADGQVLQYNSTDSEFKPVDLESGLPSGTKQLFVQTAAPTGWTKDTTHNDKAIRVVTGTVGTGGTTAFSTAFATPSVSGSLTGAPAIGNLAVSVSGNIGSTTLSVSQIPAHTHNVASDTDQSPNGGAYAASDNSHLSNFTTSSTGGGGSHNHSHNISGSLSGAPALGNLALDSSTAAINVNYVDVIIATKD